ncbi:MAG: L,D-transpeptidase family protein [Sphingomonadales bacterium]|nr:L,D-transpeptidase family protein [Sphingomonadales bacterium]
MSVFSRISVSLAALLLVGAATPAPPIVFPEVERILVAKAARTMTLFGVDGSVTVIERIQLGDEPVGPKQFEGDERTPEGRFTIDFGNPDSGYHLSLHIDYPHAEHKAFAQRHGRSAGGLIMIHGQPNQLPGAELGARVPGDWTDGCIALSNAEIEALWDAVPNGTPIEIRP